MGAGIGEWRDIPGPKTAEFIRRAKQTLFTTTVESDIVIERYEGPYLWDPDGNKYLDFASGIGVSSFGGGTALNHIWTALSDLQKTCGTCGDIGTDWYNVEHIRAAEYICQNIPLRSEKKKVYLTEGGGVANEQALKLVWDWWERRGQPDRKAIVCFEGAFHGRNGFVIKLLDPRKEVRFRGYPLPDYTVIRAPFPSLSLENPVRTMQNFMAQISKEMRNKVAAVIFEPIQGEGGITIPDSEAIRWWVDAWRNEGVPIICDEIQAGLARTGKLTACEHFGISPDITTVGKHFASGIPAAAMIGPAEFDWIELGRASESFQGSPISAIAAYATLRHILHHGIVGKNALLGEFLGDRLKERLSSFAGIKEIRGRGLMWGIEFYDSKLRDRVIYYAEHLGLRIAAAGFSENPTIRLLVSFAVYFDTIIQGVDILAAALERALTERSPKVSIRDSLYDIFD